MFEVKKVGRHWLIRPLDGEFKRLRLPADAETVVLSDNFLIVDDIVYEIKSKGDDICVVKVPDISVGEECLGEEKNLNIVHGVENIYLETNDTRNQQTNRKSDIEIEKHDDLLERQKHPALETDVTKMFPINIIDEKENYKSKLTCSGIVPKQYKVNQVMDSESISESKDSQHKMFGECLNEIPTECNEEKSLITSLQVLNEQNDYENTSEMDLGHLQDDLLESGQTEETSKIEIVKGIVTDLKLSTTQVEPSIIFDKKEGNSSRKSAKFPISEKIHVEGNDRNLLRGYVVVDKIEHIPEDTVTEIQKICHKIEEEVATDCCIFIASENVVIVYCNSSEEILKVKHLFRLKIREIEMFALGNIRTDVPTSSTSKETQNKNHGKSQTLAIEIYDWNNTKNNLKVFLLPNNVIVKVYEADILRVPVDCIVSASNGRLHHGGGVAAVIARAAGPPLEYEGREIFKEHGELQSGSACTTTAGNLPYRCVIHAIGPDWKNYKPHADSDIKMCEDALFSAIFNALHKAEENGSKSVAIPSVSSAIFCVPAQLCVYMYVQATIQYCANAGKNSLAEIHFVDVNAQMVQLIQNEFQTVVCDKKKSKYNRSDYVRQQRGRKGRNLQRETQ